MDKLKIITIDPNVPDEKKVIEVSKPQPDFKILMTIEGIKNKMTNRSLAFQKDQKKDQDLLTQIGAELGLKI